MSRCICGRKLGCVVSIPIRWFSKKYVAFENIPINHLETPILHKISSDVCSLNHSFLVDKLTMLTYKNASCDKDRYVANAGCDVFPKMGTSWCFQDRIIDTESNKQQKTTGTGT